MMDMPNVENWGFVTVINSDLVYPVCPRGGDVSENNPKTFGGWRATQSWVTKLRNKGG